MSGSSTPDLRSKKFVRGDEMQIFFAGEVIHGLGRGSKRLGCPTANINPKDLEYFRLPEGVFYGLASVNKPGSEFTDQSHSCRVYPAVMSVGRNLIYDAEQVSFEVHLMADFSEDFYGSRLTVVILGFVREMTRPTSEQHLIDMINDDKKFARDQLARYENIQALYTHPYLYHPLNETPDHPFNNSVKGPNI
eukprot:TRINITY_DN12176_c0_g1_i2.p1 TRINITY_DN12176_c0_g1~~TRINITY_DN12176_c0_g1_i2.p1  ORF type:complete len:211 (+),score=23.60 TRINITY_DN12176_c0_g1_i2:58-633(+)